MPNAIEPERVSIRGLPATVPGAWPLWSRLLVFGLAYFTCAAGGSWLTFKPTSSAGFAFSSGFLLATLLLTSKQEWPAFILAAFPVSIGVGFLIGQSGPLNLLSCFVHCGEALAGAWLVRREVGTHLTLSTTYKVLGLVFWAGVFSTALGAAVTVALLDGNSSAEAWMLAWSGDAAGVLLAAPLVLAWQPLLRQPSIRKWSGRHAKALACAAGFCFVTAYVFADPWHPNCQLKFTIIPLAAGVALTFGMPGATLASLSVAVLAAWAANGGQDNGSVASLSFRGQPLAMQVFLTVVAFTGVTSAALWSERKQTADRLRDACIIAEQRTAELEMVMNSVPAVVFFAHDPECRRIFGSRATHELLGVPLGANISLSAPPAEKPKNFRAIKDGKEVPIAQLPMQQAARGHEIRDYELEMVFDNGTVRTLFGNAAPLWDAAGKPRGAIGCFLDITERKHAEEQVLGYQRRLQALATELTRTEQRERRELATLLHDTVSQSLALAEIKLAALRNAAPESRHAQLDEIREIVRQATEGTRSLTWQLSPLILHELGLGPALEWLGEQMTQQYGVRYRFVDDGQPKPLNENTRILLFTAVRELLINVAKHAKAANAQVVLRVAGDTLEIRVEDDGIGMPVSSEKSPSRRFRGFGLFNIHERLSAFGGRLEIASRADRGTCAKLVVPFPQVPPHTVN